MTRPPSTRYRLLAPLAWLAALLLLFEDWCWDVGARIGARIGAWPPLHALEERVRRLPPYVALVAFVLPGLLLFPVKVLALVAIARGHPASGIAALVLAKIGGAAVVARLYVLTLPALLTLRWFARHHAWFIVRKDRCLAWLRASGAWRHARRLAHALRRSLRRMALRLRPRARFGSRHGRPTARFLRRFVAMWRARRRKSTESDRP
jgi:hypothetical protein